MGKHRARLAVITLQGGAQLWLEQQMLPPISIPTRSICSSGTRKQGGRTLFAELQGAWDGGRDGVCSRRKLGFPQGKPGSREKIPSIQGMDGH